MLAGSPRLHSADLEIIQNVEWQPLAAQTRRLIEATDFLGAPLAKEDLAEIQKLLTADPSPLSSEALQARLDKYCLALIHINPEMRVKVAPGPARRQLVEKGWTQFLVKVHNQAGTTAELVAISPNAIAVHEGGASTSPSSRALRKRNDPSPLPPHAELWLDLQMFNAQPLTKTLSGLGLEYRILQLYSRDAGQREARLAFNVGQGTQDLGHRNEIDLLFTAAAARPVTFNVLDEHGKGTVAGFVIRDRQGLVYPSPARRLAPDFGFHPQIYRAHGEKISLPDGTYTFEVTRGPEYLRQSRVVTVAGKSTKVDFKLQRWIDPSTRGYWSGDHHIHAAGCAHYTKPTEGVHAPDMMRHCLGEDLKIGVNLTWGPCFDYQKQFFTGKIDAVSQHPYLLRYDIEVSGFGSHQSGHLCLLRLKQQIFPGGDSYKHWPTLGLNTLRWAKKQGAITGPAHSGWGLEVETSELPNFAPAPFNGIGANEYIVDVTHEVPGPEGFLVPAVDFISTVDTPYVWELNLWYHTLNAGYRTRIAGETDFPCIYGERVGLGRSYVHLEGQVNYDDWCEGIRQGRNYVGDGKSHLMNFSAATAAQGTGARTVQMGRGKSELSLPSPGTVTFKVLAAAYLPEQARPDIKQRKYAQQPYWDIERARIDGTREVPVELLVNGVPVAKTMLKADGHEEPLQFDASITRSSWVAVRILPSSHTNPIWVTVGDKPVRASRRSVQWCLESVDRCWKNKERFIHPDEMAEAKEAYEHARVTYRQRLAECEVD
ncbi:MAG: hypothetical protein FJ404_10840 [Verrucomicrobia bacterium]|nr:hypothetical protein [Verrucomicrobiota bacterium]